MVDYYLYFVGEVLWVVVFVFSSEVMRKLCWGGFLDEGEFLLGFVVAMCKSFFLKWIDVVCLEDFCLGVS